MIQANQESQSSSTGEPIMSQNHEARREEHRTIERECGEREGQDGIAPARGNSFVPSKHVSCQRSLPLTYSVNLSLPSLLFPSTGGGVWY